MPIPELQTRTAPAKTAAPVIPTRLMAALFAAVMVFTAAAYLPALSAGLVDIDDHQLLVDNTRHQELSLESLAWMFTTTLQGHYMPLTWLSYWFDHTVGGGHPAAFHLTNIVLHAISAGLVFILISRLLIIWQSGRASNAWLERLPDEHRGRLLAVIAAMAAVLWAVHPLRVESVAWVTERRDVLSGVLLLAALLAWLSAAAPRLRAGDDVKPWRSPWYAVSIGLLGLSLLAKSWGMSLFVILLVLDVFPLRRLSAGITRQRIGQLLAEKTPFMALGGVFALIAARAVHGSGATHALADWGIAERAAQAAYGLVFYIWKSLWPTNLAVLYELPDDMDPLATRYLLCYALVLTGVGAMLALRRRAPGLIAAAAVYLITISPVLGVNQAGDQFVADRYSYLSTIPLAVLLAAGLMMLAGRVRSSSPHEKGSEAGAVTRLALPPLSPRLTLWAAAVVAMVMGTLFVATWRQTTVWHDSVTLWAHAVEVGAGTSGVQTSYAIALREAGREDESLAHLIKAVEQRPGNGRAWFMLGNVLQQRGDLAGAERAFREAAAHMRQSYMAHVNLGSLLMRQGRASEGVEAFRAAVADLERARDPREGAVSRFAYLLLGLALIESGDLQAARDALLRAKQFPELREQAAAHLAALEQMLEQSR